MKTIAVIYVVSSEGVYSQDHLTPYQTDRCYFKLYATDTQLKEITNAEEAAVVIPLVLEQIKKAAGDGVSVVLLHAFGEFHEAKAATNIPVLSLGVPTLFNASMLCRNAFTIINSVDNTVDIFEGMLADYNLMHRYKRSKKSVGLSPLEIKRASRNEVIERLIKIASVNIEEQGIDTFTLGCTSFGGFGKPLEKALRQAYPEKGIIVLDPVEFTLNLAKAI